MNKIALGYKGVFNINYIKQKGIDDTLINSAKESILNHKKMLQSPLLDGSELDIFMSMYGTNGKFDRIFIDGYKPIKYNFLDSSYMNLSTWVAQILHHKSIIKMILEEETKHNFKYSTIIITRPDITIHKKFNKISLNFDSFNITVEHPSKNCDDNFWVFPRKYLESYEKSLDLLLSENKMTHELNHKLLNFGVPIHYMENLVDSYMGHKLFTFIR